jgi:hypothetical protein
MRKKKDGKSIYALNSHLETIIRDPDSALSNVASSTHPW